MGSELSCPCGNRTELEEEVVKERLDIVEELLKGKLKEEEINFQYLYDQSKICLIRSDQFEAFFANRNFLKLSSKKEINYYYNLVYMANFITDKNFVFIFLQYSPGMEDKSVNNTSSLNGSRNKISKKKVNSNFDYKTNYKIQIINLVSNERKKVIEQILNDLNSNLKRDFMFYGIINDFDETPGDNLRISSSFISGPNNIINPTMRNYKVLYKRSLLKEVTDCKYTIETFEGRINRDIINDILSENKNCNKILKAIIVDTSLGMSNSINISNRSFISEPKNYYFIFEENFSVPQTFVYLVIEMTQGSTSDKIFLQDITIKLNDYQNDYKLCCLVNDDKRFYVIFAADSETLDGDEDTPYDENL